MRSFVIFAIEHGETTAPLENFVADAYNAETPHMEIIDHVFRVDVGLVSPEQAVVPVPVVHYAEPGSRVDQGLPAYNRESYFQG